MGHDIVTMNQNIKLGVHTMMWGCCLTSEQVELMLKEICQISAKNGFSTIGIEFGQKIHHLGVDYRNDDVGRSLWLAKLFKNGFDIPSPLPGKPNHVDLKLLGFSGRGSLAKRVEFCELLADCPIGKVLPEYFLIQNWYDQYAEETNEKGKTLLDRVCDLESCIALHPFRFGPFDKLKEIGEKFQHIDSICGEMAKDSVQFLPDTAHLWLANHCTLHWLIEGVFHNYNIEIPFGTQPDSVPVLDRTVAIHLKDWKKTYESSLRYYSRGFTELGSGYISMRTGYNTTQSSKSSDLGVLREMLLNFEGGFPKWCVIEQDYTVYNPKDSLEQSLIWLLKGNASQQKREPREVFVSQKSHPISSHRVSSSREFDDRKSVFIQELHQRSPESSAEYVRTLRCLLRYLFNDEELDVGVWELSPRVSSMVLLNENNNIAGYEASASYKITNDSCTGIRVWDIDINQKSGSCPKDEREELFIAYPELAIKRATSVSKVEQEGQDRKAILWIPVCNSYNFNQIEARVDIFMKAEKLPIFPGEDSPFAESYRYKLEEYLEDVIQHIALTLEKMWGNIAYQAKSELVSETLQCFDSDSMYRNLLDRLRKRFSHDTPYIEGTDYTTWSVFKYEREGDVFSIMDFKDVSSNKEQVFPKDRRGILDTRDIDIWLTLVNPRNTSRKIPDITENNTKKITLSSIAIPLFGLKRSEDDSQNFFIDNLGIIVGRRLSRVFSASDENTIQEMLSGFVPLLSNKISDERRARSVRFIRHELGHPISALDRLTDVIKNEMEFKSGSKYRNYPKEWKTYVDLLQGITSSSFFITGEDLSRTNRKEVVDLLTSDVLFPVIHQGPSMIDKNLVPGIVEEIEAKKAIRIFYCERGSSTYFYVSNKVGRQAPLNPIVVNKGHLFLVFFNLLSNSLKYSWGLKVPDLVNDEEYRLGDQGAKGKRVQIDILVKELPGTDSTHPNGLEVLFRDFGQGIHGDLHAINKNIFDDGVRLSEHRDHVLGDGIGLWVSKKIIKNHKGIIKLTRNELPTEFCIRFPKEIFQSFNQQFKKS